MAAHDPVGPPAADDGPTAQRLQGLLARAAEEQLSEQRQVSAELVELRTVVGELTAQLVAVRQAVEALERRVEAVVPAVAAHVDEAVLALADVLLRRRRGGRDTISAGPARGGAAGQLGVPESSWETVGAAWDPEAIGADVAAELGAGPHAEVTSAAAVAERGDHPQALTDAAPRRPRPSRRPAPRCPWPDTPLECESPGLNGIDGTPKRSVATDQAAAAETQFRIG